MTEAAETDSGASPRAYRLGSRVRTAGRAELEAVLLDPRAPRRPSPAQFQAAAREAHVVGVVFEAGQPLHRLDRVPGLWPAAWLRPAAFHRSLG